MSKSFKQFRADREVLEFGRHFDSLCESIALTGISFDEFWLNQGLPTLLNANTERDLLEGWHPKTWDWKGMGQAAGNFFNGPQQSQPTPPPVQAAPPQRPQLSDHARSKAEETMKFIKDAFAKSMDTVINTYKKNRDSVGYQLASGFRDKVNAYADKLKVNRGEGSFDADKHFGPMSPEQITNKASTNRTVNPQMAGDPNVQTAMGNAPPDMMHQQVATGQTDTLPTGGVPSIQQNRPKQNTSQYWNTSNTAV